MSAYTGSSGNAGSCFNDPTKKSAPADTSRQRPDPPNSAQDGTESSSAYPAGQKPRPIPATSLALVTGPPRIGSGLADSAAARRSSRGREAGVTTPLTSGRSVAAGGAVITAQKEGGRLCEELLWCLVPRQSRPRRGGRGHEGERPVGPGSSSSPLLTGRDA